MRNLIYLFLTVLIVACSGDDNPCDTSPIFSNIIASNVSYTSFDLNGTITPSSCDSNVITQGIVYSTNELPTQSNNPIVFSNNTYTETITNLSLQTTYYIRPFFENQDGVFYGNQTSVTTLSSSISFSNISHTPSIASVLISANYSFDNGIGVSTINKGVIINGIQYDDSESLDGNISLTIENLEPETNYSYTLFVTNEFGTSESSSSSFQTENASSVVSSLNISNIGFSSADLLATYQNLYSGGDLTIDKGVVLSLNSDFQNQTAYSSFNSESGVIEVSLAALELNTTYFVKPYVENEFGLNYGDITDFETLNIEYSYSYTVNNIGYDFANIDVEYNQISFPQLDVLEKGIEILDMPSYNVVDSNSPDGLISLELPNLTQNTNYSFVGYLTTQYGKYYLNSFDLNTLDATPSFASSVSDITVDSANISTTFNFAPETNNSLVRIVLINDGNEQYIILGNDQSNQETQVDNLFTNTNYSYHIEVTNEYGSFNSPTYQFITLDDEPEIDFSYTLTGENQITLNGLITPANNGEIINSISIQYKNNEEENYITINLSNSNYSISEVLDDLVQGPNYNFKLVIVTNQNTFEENLYYNIPVTYEVGDIMFGGIIVSIEASGYHGRIAAEPANYSAGLFWSTDYSNTMSSDPGQINPHSEDFDGRDNTQRIIDYYNLLNESSPATEHCYYLNVNGYDDWYFPTLQEISIMEQVIDIQSIAVWSCIESGTTSVWTHYYTASTHSHSNVNKQSTSPGPGSGPPAIAIPLRRF